MASPKVFTISPALPFLDTFVESLDAGDLIGPVAGGLARADMTIYVPTRRAAQTLAETFLARAPHGTAILPRILPLGALESTEGALLFEEADAEGTRLALPAAASPVWRRFQLTRLIHDWARAIDGAVCRVDPSGQVIIDPSEAFRVATSVVDAFALAGALADLIDEMQIEDVSWRALDDLDMASFDDYWRITTRFLSIAIDAWPKVLAETARVDPTARRIALIDAQARRYAAGEDTRPVLAIGSTGSNRATARLLAAVARAPLGAVVLPGLDRDLDEAAWQSIAGGTAPYLEASFGHPQAALARLLPILGVRRADVRPLGPQPSPAAALRARLIAEALRPADTTETWKGFRRAHPAKTLAAALADITLVEAADEREEALCIAVALREVLETPGRRAALITPDRELARRVRGELLRWDVEIDDSGGEPLARTPLGILARLVIAAAASGLAARDVGALLAHPLATFGLERSDIARRAAQLDLAVLRCVPARGRAMSQVLREARLLAQRPHAHRAQKALRDADWAALDALWQRLDDAVAPLLSLTNGTHDVAAFVAAHRAALDAIAGDRAEDEDAALTGLFDELATGGEGSIALRADDYALLFGRLLNDATLRTAAHAEPRLQILGLLEARLLHVDLAILGGLDETIWPPPARADAFLNRPMRHALGLTPPERRLGQTAHDFQQAMGQPEVIVTRALKRAGTPCVASRFLLRLEALAGEAWQTCRQRGLQLRDLAERLDKNQQAAVPIKRPCPTPPVALRPQRLSVTQIETLRRDPYAIFASEILRLAALPNVGAVFDPRLVGERIHAALQRFTSAMPSEAAATSDIRRAALLEVLADEFADMADDPHFGSVRWPLLQKAADVFLSFDSEQRRLADAIMTEIGGQLDLVLADLSPFTLRARADRIDFRRDGSALLVDYKTGQPPGQREISVGFAPQLTLEAAILREGGFGRVHTGPIEAVYLKLGGKDGGKVHNVKFDDEEFLACVDRHLDGLKQLLSSFRLEDTAYPSRPFPKFAKRDGDFDHLARVREWSLTGDEDKL
jgi:ATP-dependent helicase/nuclease subunit B